jgi:hypothetical protein
MIREYITTPYCSRFEAFGISLAVAVFTRELALYNTAVAFGILVATALIVAAAKTFWSL